MKLKLTVTAFYDKVEEKYIFREETPTIEREDERGRQLIKAGVCEELIEPEEESENPSEEAPSEPEPEQEKKKLKSWLKK